MRIRATVAAVSGALALSALAAPAAQASGDAASRADIAKVREAAHAASSDKAAFSARAATYDEPYALNVTFSNFKIAKAIKVGTSNRVTTKVTYTLTHGADVDVTALGFLTDPFLYKGSFAAPQNVLIGDDFGHCKATSATKATCSGTIDIRPKDGELLNADAGTWKAGAWAIAFNGEDLDSDDLDMAEVGYAEKGGLGTTKVQRYSKLTVNASPEPVKKGKTLTVTGKLTRANWETNKYAGYTKQPVKLQFKKKGTSTYTTLKTITTDAKGNLKTTVKASVDGYYRYSFAGNTPTPAVNSAGDFIDVK
ncbi:hypothetical protein ACTWJ9_18395 [Streptomyces sp. GDS52]|uniref:hypothetical protein n=1 Tax=Streptomyces sp. GDS52 TaxID=3406419 RepID=UPI003FD4CDEA